MTLSVLQVGCGAFGPTHLGAWHRLGFADRLFVADPDPRARQTCRDLGVPEARILANYRQALPQVDIVDVVTPLGEHAVVAEAALQAGKHVFLEKPATATTDDAVRLALLAREAGRIVQVGYYFRAHPLAVLARGLIEDGAIGRLRTIAGRFVGYKRARPDSGALLNDAVHFIDLASWLIGTAPASVYAEMRRDLGLDAEDFVNALLTYPAGVLARIEAGWTEPGTHLDAIVPGALTTKAFTVCGDTGAVELDFSTDILTHHRVRHVWRDGGLAPDFGERTAHTADGTDAVAVVAREFAALIDSVLNGRPVMAGLGECGVTLGYVLDAIRASSANRRVEAVAPSRAEPLGALAP